MILRLRQQHKELLRQEANRVRPIEACGMLFGKPSRMRTIVEKIILTQNTLSSSERFEINPETAVKAIRESEEDDLDLIGLFHSHSAPANPSKTDLKFMKLWGSAIWLILSLTDGQFAAFQVENGKLETVVIEVE